MYMNVCYNFKTNKIFLLRKAKIGLSACSRVKNMENQVYLYQNLFLHLIISLYTFMIRAR